MSFNCFDPFYVGHPQGTFPLFIEKTELCINEHGMQVFKQFKILD